MARRSDSYSLKTGLELQFVETNLDGKSPTTRPLRSLATFSSDMENTPIDLQQFCYRPKHWDARGSWVEQPWHLNGCDSATDRRIMVFRHDTNEFPDLTIDQYPHLDALLSMMRIKPGSLRPVVVADKKLPPVPPCKHCNGTGRLAVQVECPDCKGEGVITCGECGHNRDCESCEGRGEINDDDDTETCHHCDGLKTNPMGPIKVGPARVAWRYLNLLKQIPECVLYPHEHNRPMYFEFQGGHGVLMPMK